MPSSITSRYISCGRSRSALRRLGGGFTVIELLMSVAISAMLLAGAAVAISVASQTMEVNRRHSDFSHTGRLILTRIAREVRAADAVSVSNGVLSIIPPAGSGYDICRYSLDDSGALVYSRISSGVATNYPLVNVGDDISVSTFDITSETVERDGVQCTASVSIKLVLTDDGDSIVLSSSACPRRNMQWYVED